MTSTDNGSDGPRTTDPDPDAHGSERTAVLVLHGFTGNPSSVSGWAQALTDRGFETSVPLLPGHGTTWQDLNTTTWQDWYTTAEQALLTLAEQADRVVVAGLSMGGALSLRLAERHPRVVDALVLVNPAIASRDKRLLALPVLKYLTASIPAIGDDIKKPGVTEGAYERTPLRALHSMTQLWRDVVDHLDRVQCEVTVLRSPEDHVVDDSTLLLLQERLRSPLTHIPLPDSYHVATLDNDAERIIEVTARIAEGVSS